MLYDYLSRITNYNYVYENFNFNFRYELSSDSRGFGKVDDLLEAYDQKDDDKFKDIIKNYLSYAVDNEVRTLYFIF